MKNNYEIWAIGYNNYNEITDVNECIKTLEDVSEDDAIEFARSLTSKEDIVPLLKAFKADIDECDYFNIVVEVVEPDFNDNRVHVVYSTWTERAVTKVTHKKMNAKQIELTMDELIDYLCDMNGVKWTIKYLYENCAWTTDELHDAGFLMDDIYMVIAEIK